MGDVKIITVNSFECAAWYLATTCIDYKSRRKSKSVF
jgi:hypothetical protein